jgi:hypothetical protein
MIWWLLACHKTGFVAPEPSEPLPIAAHQQAEAAALIWNPDAERSGAPLHRSQSPLPPFRGVNRGTATYLGSENCAACHTSEYERWTPSAHAHAMTTLGTHQRASDPDCMKCHFTGFQQPGSALNSNLANVGCESCHGPGSDHVVAPDTQYGALPASAAACVACHSYDNSPDFRWESYWPKIAH